MSKQLDDNFTSEPPSRIWIQQYDKYGGQGNYYTTPLRTECVAYVPEDSRTDLARKVLAEIRPIADRDHAGEECVYALQQLFVREGVVIEEVEGGGK